MKKCREQIAAEILSLSKNGRGRITPEAVVLAAEPDDSVLHDSFEWNNDRAAELYRLEQARNLIRSVLVSYEGRDGEVEYRQFVSLSTERNDGYRLVSCVMENKAHRDQMLADAKAEMDSFQQKYSCLVKLRRLWPVIRKIFD